MGRRIHNLVGQTLGNWQALEELPSINGQRKYRFRCVCGTEATFWQGKFLSGRYGTDCGCIAREAERRERQERYEALLKSYAREPDSDEYLTTVDFRWRDIVNIDVRFSFPDVDAPLGLQTTVVEDEHFTHRVAGNCFALANLAVLLQAADHPKYPDQVPPISKDVVSAVSGIPCGCEIVEQKIMRHWSWPPFAWRDLPDERPNTIRVPLHEAKAIRRVVSVRINYEMVKNLWQILGHSGTERYGCRIQQWSSGNYELTGHCYALAFLQRKLADRRWGYGAFEHEAELLRRELLEVECGCQPKRREHDAYADAAGPKLKP